MKNIEIKQWKGLKNEAMKKIEIEQWKGLKLSNEKDWN